MRPFFEIIRKNGLLSKGVIDVQRIKSLTPNKIISLSETLLQISDKKIESPSNAVCAHTASLSLGGGIEDCAELRCRMSKLNSLTRFAAMYSDHVYINNFFTKYNHIKKINKFKDASLLINQTFYNDLYLINSMRPLLEKGVISLHTPQKHFCPSCLAGINFGETASKQLRAARNRLSKEYFINTSINFECKKGIYALICKGPESLFEHGTLTNISSEPPLALSTKPHLIDRAKKGERICLSQDVRKKLKIHEKFADEVVRNIAFELATTQETKSSFLTNKSLHISFLKSISNNPEIEQRNNIAFKHLSLIVPFVEDVAIKDLIKLRSRENKSFILYRKALNDVIDEFRLGKKTFKAKDASALYADVIHPKLTALENRIKHAKRDLIKKPFRTALATVGTISFGLYSGLIPAEFAAIASSAGLSTIGFDFLKQLSALGDAEDTVRSDNLFFLWKVKQLSGIK